MVVGLGRKQRLTLLPDRQATQEQTEDPPRYGQGQGCHQEEGQVSGSLGVWGWGLLVDNACVCTHCDGFHHIAHGNLGRHENMDGMNLDRSPRLSSISIKGVLLPNAVYVRASMRILGHSIVRHTSGQRDSQGGMAKQPTYHPRFDWWFDILCQTVHDPCMGRRPWCHVREVLMSTDTFPGQLCGTQHTA